MKKLLLLLFVLTSASVFAGNMPTVDSSWEEIRTSRNRVIFELPQYNLSHGWYMRAGSVCIDGEDLRSIKKVQKCVRWSGGRNERCLEFKEIYPSMKIEGTRNTCTRWSGGRNDRCTRYEEIPYKITTEFNVKVYRRRSGGRDGDDYDASSRFKPLFGKMFSIPQCD